MATQTLHPLQKLGLLASKFAIFYLFALAFMVWGYSIHAHHIWPYELVRELQEYEQGHKLAKETTLFEKLMNDAGIKPTRLLRDYPAVVAENTRIVAVDGLDHRPDMPLVYTHAEHQQGYRAIFGAFNFTDHFWGGLLIDGHGVVRHQWRLSTAHLSTAHKQEQLSDLYGLLLKPDGSIIFNLQERGGGIVKIDACSQPVWGLKGEFHHTISPTDDGHLWAYQGKQEDFDHLLVKINEDTGTIVQTIDMVKVRAANPYISIFNLQENPATEDLSHGNDIDPLTASMAPYFPQFNVGDLLLSYRTQNLLFVLDPRTLKVKWWRVGAWAKQHDPDWESDGWIHVFSNNSDDKRQAARPYSDIVAINPQTMETRIDFDGQALQIFSSIQGDHSLTPYGTRMITSTNQGLALEVDQTGQLVFSFINNHDAAERKSLILSKAIRIEDSQIHLEEFPSCINN